MAIRNDPNAYPIEIHEYSPGFAVRDEHNHWQHMHEWELATMHRRALKDENYERCQEIQNEVDRRIETGTIDKALMDGFRYWNLKTDQYEGPPNFEGFNGLFDKYKY